MSGGRLDLSSRSDRELDELLNSLSRNNNVSGIKEIVDEKDRRAKKEKCFLSGILMALKEKIHTDIQLRAGKDNGPCIPAHRVILASRSKIFKQMLECEVTLDNKITLPELNSEELETLLEFLYGGSIAQDKMEKHLHSLFHAAHKYEIPYLQECCERHILDSLNASNVLNALEISDVFSSEKIMDAALKIVVRNMDDITLSSKYDVFAAKNPHLSVQITRAYVNHARNYVPKVFEQERNSFIRNSFIPGNDVIIEHDSGIFSSLSLLILRCCLQIRILMSGDRWTCPCFPIANQMTR